MVLVGFEDLDEEEGGLNLLEAFLGGMSLAETLILVLVVAVVVVKWRTVVCRSSDLNAGGVAK